MDYLKTDGTLQKKAVELIRSLMNGKFHKLSDFYASRSTSYPSVLTSDLFIISSNKQTIVEAGFASTCKAIVKVNEKNKYVIKEIKAIQAEIKRSLKSRLAEEKKLKAMTKEAKAFIKANKELVEKLKNNTAEKRNPIYKRDSFSSKELQDVAWKLQNRAKDKGLMISKTAFHHALSI